MNNLLKTLAASHVKADDNLKLLLATVKESRRHTLDSSKLSDPFYDSLEGLLADLRTVTIDNHDADAFLRPVLKSEAPDYYEVITNPMDLQTMQRKVKQKQYKSKREFKDDLDLIWSNCFTYNASENHPLRQCARRLQTKAEVLLRNITDRKERNDPPIPPQLIAPHKPPPVINGTLLNGNGHYRSPSAGKPGTIVIKPPPSSIVGKAKPVVKNRPTPTPVAPIADFGLTPAIVRTRDGMETFMHLEKRALDVDNLGGAVKIEGMDKFDGKEDLLHDLAKFLPKEDDSESDHDESPYADCHDLGQKRKLNDLASSRSRKRSKTVAPILRNLTLEDEITNKWWTVVQTDSFLGNGLPHIPFPHSSNHHPRQRRQLPQSSDTPRHSLKRKRKGKDEVEGVQDKSMFSLMNNNIRTLKRVRVTHSKFSALLSASGGIGDEGEGEAAGLDPTMTHGAGPSHHHRSVLPPPILHPPSMDDIETDQPPDDRPWKLVGRGIRSGLDMGKDNADDCVKWTSRKVLEHVGFQGSSEAAMQVLVSVASEYLMNVGKTMRFLTEKFAGKMTPEELILHTLFESGIEDVKVLERYVFDDVERYGHRLDELEKKLVGAYNELTTTDGLEDEGLFDDDDEEAGALAMGDFADVLGEDYLGLRALGIASEFGMSSLTIPKRLLRRKKYLQSVKEGDDAKFKPPPLPFPPPEPFVPLESTGVDKQIGLLRPYLRKRFVALAAKPLPAPVPQQPPAPALPTLRPPSLSGPGVPTLQPPSLAGPSIPGVPPASTLQPSVPSVPQVIPPSGAIPIPQPPVLQQPPPVLLLSDDPPSPARVKMGPLGQIIRPGSSATAKKKAAAASNKMAASAGGTGGAGAGARPEDGKTPVNVNGVSGPTVPLPTVALSGGGVMMNGVNGTTKNQGGTGHHVSPRPLTRPLPPNANPNNASGGNVGKQTNPQLLPPVVAASA